MKQNGKLKRRIEILSIKAEKALKEAVTDTIKEHEKAGYPLAMWRDGKVVWVPAKQLLRKS